MKTIQCLTVAVMMAVMVYTAPVTEDDLLKDIHDAALNISKMNTKLHLHVKEIGQDGGPPCVHNFFCLAEKSLDNATEKYKLHEETLIQTLNRRLEMFNNKTGSTQCHLDTNIEYPLEKFLRHIRKCVDLWRTIPNHQ